MSVRYVHHSDTPVIPVYSRGQAPHETYWPKPRGLWLSVEDDALPPEDRMSWADWCAGERFEIGARRHIVTLSDKACILRITSSAEIDDFTTEYGRSRQPSRARYKGYVYWLDWAAVARRFDGIIIAPYQWARRLDDHTSWYYPWDCASGCIWNASAIESIVEEQLTEEAAA